MKKAKNLNGYAIYQAGARDVTKYGFEDGSFYVYFASDVRDFGLTNSTPEYEGYGSLEEAEANCTGNFARAKEIVEERTTAASIEEILEVEAQLDAGMDPDEIAELAEQETIADVIASKFPNVPQVDPQQNPAKGRPVVTDGSLRNAHGLQIRKSDTEQYRNAPARGRLPGVAYRHR